MLFSRKSLLAVAAATGYANAQASTAYVDPDTSISFQRFSTTSGGGYSFGIALPGDATTEWIGKLEGPITGWSGVSLGGGMPNSLLVIAWASADSVVASLRQATGYVAPDDVYADGTITEMYSSVNDTHFSYTFRCENCITWGDYGFDPTLASAIMGYAIASPDVADVTDAAAVLEYHDSGMGQYSMAVASAASADYQSWLDAAGISSGNGTTTTPSTPSTTANSTASAIPAATETLGTFDYIIAGGGAGGLVAADKLSESGASVLLIERGPPSTARWGGTLAPDWLQGENLTRFDVPGLCNEIWQDSAGIACTDVDQMAGCVLGGGTAINAGMFFRAQDYDWDHNWPEGWKATDMADAQERLFSRIPSTDTPSMDGKRYLQETYDVISNAVSEAGWKEVTINETPNSKLKSYSHAPFMYSDGERGGPMATYLQTAHDRSNFQMVLNTQVRRVIRTGSTITGVEVYSTADDGSTGIYTVTESTGKVILSAGAFGTPKILFRSGIGPQDQLEKVAASGTDGDSMIASDDWIISPVGYHLMDHTNTDMVVSAPKVEAYDFYAAYDEPIASDMEAYLGNRSGVLSNAAPGIPMVLYDQIEGSDGVTRQIQWTARAEGSLGESGETLMTLSQYLGTGATSRGRLTITSSLDISVSELPYAKTAEDQDAIFQGVKNMLDALQGATTTNETALTVLQPASNTTAEEYTTNYIQSRGTNHWLGSAMLGTEDGTQGNGTTGAVVDTNTKVYGTDNLFVIDASLFPGFTSTNPSAPIMIVAEHAAELILALGGNSTTTVPQASSAPSSKSTAPATSAATSAATSVASMTGTAIISSSAIPTASSVSSSAVAVPTSAPSSAATTSAAAPTNASSTSSAASPSGTTIPQYYQCGGRNYQGVTECAAPYTCTEQNEYYSQCI